jgi:hypothetical protein
MNLPNKYRVVFKIISAVLAGVFLFDQIAWAGDLINVVLEQQCAEQSQTFAPTYLQNQQTAVENLITQKQSIENALSTQDILNNAIITPPEESLDLQGPCSSSEGGGGANMLMMQGEGGDPSMGFVLSVTTQAGDVINYRDGAIYSIEKEDGSVLTNIVVDENNNLLGAEITYSDGTVQNITNGRVSNVIRPDGTIFDYDEQELLYSITSADGAVANCSYVLDGQGNIIETILTDSEKITHYDNTDRLLKVEFDTGKTIEYDSGVVSQITESDNAIFIFNIETNIDNTITSSLSQYVDVSSTIYDYTPGGSNPTVVIAAVKQLGIVNVLYDAERKVSRVTTFDGTAQNYTDGLINSVSGSFGSVLCSYNFDAGSSIKKLAVDYDGIQNIYDKYGNIAEISACGITLSMSNGAVLGIKKSDGTLIEDALFDANNNIVSAKITRPDGLEVIYREGVLSEVRQPDGGVFYYDNNGKIIKLVDPKGITYLYSSVEEEGLNFTVAYAQDPDSITNLETMVRQKYDSNMRLIEALRKDGVIFTYSYTFDAEGNVRSTAVSDGDTITTYDENNNIKRTEVLPTTEDPISTISEYEYGRIRRVYKGNDLIYSYSYEFDDAEAEITVIEDVKTGDMKRYKNEFLVSVSGKDGLITLYEYNIDKQISRSIVTYCNQIINIYTYSYEGKNTIISDIDGAKRTYDEDNKLIRLEEGNKVYAYAYSKDETGTEITIQSLISVKDDFGAITHYQQGMVESIYKSDGTIIKDIVFNRDDIKSYVIEKEGIEYYIKDDKVIKEIRGDKTIINYNTESLVSSVSEPSGKVIYYDYEYANPGQVEYITVSIDSFKYRYDRNGVFIEKLDNNNVHYYYDNSDKLREVVDKNKQIFNFSLSGSASHVYSFYEVKQDIANEIRNFAKENLAIEGPDGSLKIVLDRNYEFDYGDGSDGDLRVEAGKTVVIDGTKNYKSIYVAPGAVLTVVPWNGVSGGELILKSQGPVKIEGTVDVSAVGYRGGNTYSYSYYSSVAEYKGIQGESYSGARSNSTNNNFGGGGGFQLLRTTLKRGYVVGGAGGSYGTAGKNAIGNGYGAFYNAKPVSYAGQTYGDKYLNVLYRGSGGGAGIYYASNQFQSSAGGNGGGALKIVGSEVEISGTVLCNGGNGVMDSGGGSGGSVYIIGRDINIKGSITAKGGNGGGNTNVPAAPSVNVPAGGAGGDGRIRIDYVNFEGNIPNPIPYMYQIPYYDKGNIISDPIVLTATELGGVTANIETPAGTILRFLTRTGATADVGDGTWSDWTEATKTLNEYKINSPVNKYIQYNSIFETTNTNITPAILQTDDFAIKLSCSYSKDFDANAPPSDLLFKDHLILTPPQLPIFPSLETVKSIPAQTQEIESRILPDSTIIETRSFEEDSRNITVETAKNNKLTYYVDGKAYGTYQKYDDNRLELLTQYLYDSEGNLVSVDLPSTRNSLDTQILTARQQISAERVSYLRTLAEQKGLACDQIRNQVQTIRNQINAERDRLQPLLYQEVTRSRWVGWWIFGWYETYRETVEVPEVRAALNQLNEQERQLNNEEANSYAQLSAQVENAKQTLIQDEEAALAEVAAQEEAFQAQIIAEESTPVILECYRSMLGRDPNEAETQAWIDTVSYDSKIDTTALKNTLINSQERVQQEAFVAVLKNSISNSLYNYLALDDAGKESFLGDIGLTSTDTIKLGLEDVEGILSLLDTQNIHFGRSAFVSLGTILSNNSVTYDIESLALKTVLVDVFTGSLNKFSEDSLLELSMFALSKTASVYGIELNNTRLNFDDLTQAFNSSGQVIAHLKNDHYVVVTNITADGNISYKEHNRGQNGYTWTVSRQDFENSWTGYAIVQKISAQGVVPDTVLAKKVSDDVAMRIKGSCLPFLFPLLGAIFGGIAGAATAVVGAITAVVAGISTLLAPIITGIAQLVTGVAGFMTHIGSTLFSAVQFVGTSLLPTIGGWIGGIGSWIGGIGGWLGSLGGIISPTGFSLSGLGLALGKTVVATALSIGISKGLEALGINSTISGLLSSFATGGVSGIFNNGFSTLSFLTGGMQGLAIQGVNQLGAKLGIDLMLSNVISLSAGSFIGAVGNNISSETGLFDLEGFSASIGEQIMPNVSSELAYYGITKAGDLLGIDSRISYLAGVGIRSTINAGLTHDFKPDVIWGSVQNGLLRGITSVALEWGAESLGLSPLIGSLTSAAIAGGLEALLMGQNPVQEIYETYFRAGTGLLTLGYDGSDNPWLRAAYISQVLDFSQIVQERGIANALETYSAGFLHQQTINEIWKQGGIAQLLTEPNQVEMTTDRKGQTVKRIYTMVINSENDKLLSNYIDLSPTYDMLMGFREGNVITHCEFVIGADGRPQLKNGEREVWNDDGSYRIEYVENFNLTRVEHYDPIGNVVGFTFPTAGTSSIMVGADGNISSGDFVSLITDYSVSIKDNQVTELNFKRDCAFDATDITTLLNLGLAEQDIAGFKEVVSFVNGVVEYCILPPDTAIFDINAEEGRAWREGIEARGRAFWTGVNYLIGEYLSGDPLPEITADSVFPLANINLHLAFPGASETMTEYGLSLFNLMTGNLVGPMNEAGQALIAPSRWTYNTNRSAELIASSLAMGYQFVFDGGVDTSGLNALKQNVFYYSFDTTESIAVGNSAGVTSMVKSWTIPGCPQAENYFLFTPQFVSPDYVYEQMQLAGISPDRVTVVEIAGDFVTTSGFQDNYEGDVKKWNYVKLQSGGNLSWWNVYGNHGAAVNGIITGSVYDEIIVDNQIRTGVTLIEILKEKIVESGE